MLSLFSTRHTAGCGFYATKDLPNLQDLNSAGLVPIIHLVVHGPVRNTGVRVDV